MIHQRKSGWLSRHIAAVVAPLIVTAAAVGGGLPIMTFQAAPEGVDGTSSVVGSIDLSDPMNPKVVAGSTVTIWSVLDATDSPIPELAIYESYYIITPLAGAVGSLSCVAADVDVNHINPPSAFDANSLVNGNCPSQANVGLYTGGPGPTIDQLVYLGEWTFDTTGAEGDFEIAHDPAFENPILGSPEFSFTIITNPEYYQPVVLTILPQPDPEPIPIGGISSRAIQIDFNDIVPPGPELAMRVTNQCTGEDGWAAMRDVNYNDGAQGMTNVAVVNNASGCNIMRTVDEWLSDDGKLILVGDIITPESQFTVDLVTDCGSMTVLSSGSTTQSTWRYGDTTGDCVISSSGDLLKTFSNTSQVTSQMGWAADFSAGYEVDIQGPNPSDVPDGLISFSSDVLNVFYALPQAGGQPFLGQTCPDACTPLPSATVTFRAAPEGVDGTMSSSGTIILGDGTNPKIVTGSTVTMWAILDASTDPVFEVTSLNVWPQITPLDGAMGMPVCVNADMDLSHEDPPSVWPEDSFLASGQCEPHAFVGGIWIGGAEPAPTVDFTGYAGEFTFDTTGAVGDFQFGFAPDDGNYVLGSNDSGFDLQNNPERFERIILTVLPQP